jgi:hypothetical protein
MELFSPIVQLGSLLHAMEWIYVYAATLAATACARHTLTFGRQNSLENRAEKAHLTLHQE